METCDSCSRHGENLVWLEHNLVRQIGKVKQECQHGAMMLEFQAEQFAVNSEARGNN